MFRKILVALDTTPSDQELLPHITRMAGLLKSDLILLHVADGWVARNFDNLSLAESEEMKGDMRYLEEMASHWRTQSGLNIETRLALGDPPAQILQAAEKEGCDLIALASHGHRLVGDLIHGATIEAVRHKAHVPIIVVPPRAGASPPKPVD